MQVNDELADLLWQRMTRFSCSAMASDGQFAKLIVGEFSAKPC